VREAAAEAEWLEGQLVEHDVVIAELESRVVDWAYCARCHTWATRAEWAWEFDGNGDTPTTNQLRRRRPRRRRRV
jgi:hypothetical protein